jgi:hypothetical protein
MNLILDVLERISNFSMPQILPTEIICGDCCGNDLIPKITNLTSDNRCAVCDGRSFELASQICGALSQHLKGKIQIERKNQNHDTTFTHSKTNGNFIEIDTELRH